MTVYVYHIFPKKFRKTLFIKYSHLGTQQDFEYIFQEVQIILFLICIVYPYLING